jgi:hypothetical protein
VRQLSEAGILDLEALPTTADELRAEIKRMLAEFTSAGILDLEALPAPKC